MNISRNAFCAPLAGSAVTPRLRRGSIIVVVVAVLAGLVSCGGGGYGGSSSSGSTTYTVGGTLTGATGQVTLKLIGANNVVVSTLALPTPGPFTFTPGLAYLATYTVTATSTTQNCTVTSGAAGPMGFANVMDVTVNCV